MANLSQKDNTMLFVGKDLAITATASCTMAAIGDGEVRCFTPGGTCYTEAAADAGDSFYIAMGRGTGVEPLKSAVIKLADVKRISKKDYAAGTVQLDYIGSNGTSGSIEVNNNTVYRAVIDMKESPVTLVGGGLIKDMVYKSDSAATQSEIALGLAASGVANFSREAEQSVGFKAICDSAVTAANDFVNNITVVNGSTVVSVATAITWGAAATTLAVGDFVRMGSNGAGTALTDDVYKVTAVDTTNLQFTVDRPVQVTSQVLTAATSDAEVIAAATGVAANWGVSLTGQTLAFVAGKINNKVAKWKLTLESGSFGTTTLVHSTSASLGTGTTNQVAEMEVFLNGNNGEFYKSEAVNNFPMTTMTVAGTTYDFITIEMERGRTDSIGYVNSPQDITIAIPSTTGGNEWYANASTDDVTDVLEQLLAGAAAYTTANSFDGSVLTTGDLTCG